MRDLYIGGLKIYGTLEQEPAIIKMLRVDLVVVTDKLSPARRLVAQKMFAACGVKAVQFGFREDEL